MWTASCAGSTFRPFRNRARRLLKGFWLAALLGLGPAGFAPGALAADYPLEVLELRYRLPEELVPILTPLAGPGGTVIGARHALFVRASPERLSDIRRALAELDRPARSLVIQVRQGSHAEAAGAGLGVRIDEPIGSGDTRGRVRVGPPGAGGSQVAASAGQRSERRDLTQEVRALDGHPAFIAVGREQALPYRELEVGPGGALLREGTAYRSAQSGFFVIPRVLEDRVTLEIETRSASPGRGGSIDTGSVRSRVEGRLGDWIPVGASSGSEELQGSGLSFRGQGRQTIQGQVELRVLPLD